MAETHMRPEQLRVTLVVITAVDGYPGNHAAGDCFEGYLAYHGAPPMAIQDLIDQPGWAKSSSAQGLFALRLPVFRVGEILLLDASGREVAPPGRKPSKWSVTYQVCETVEEATALARSLVPRDDD